MWRKRDRQWYSVALWLTINLTPNRWIIIINILFNHTHAIYYHHHVFRSSLPITLFLSLIFSWLLCLFVCFTLKRSVNEKLKRTTTDKTSSCHHAIRLKSFNIIIISMNRDVFVVWGVIPIGTNFIIYAFIWTLSRLSALSHP